jgi:hypothetical protein
MGRSLDIATAPTDSKIASTATVLSHSSDNSNIDGGILIQSESKKEKKWYYYLWDTLDKPKEERWFMFKLDAALLTFASLGVFYPVPCL